MYILWMWLYTWGHVVFLSQKIMIQRKWFYKKTLARHQQHDHTCRSQYGIPNRIHWVLDSCGFQWCIFHLCEFSKHSPNIQILVSNDLGRCCGFCLCRFLPDLQKRTNHTRTRCTDFCSKDWCNETFLDEVACCIWAA